MTLLGENRAQDLAAKAEAHPGAFRWHFIGQLQSRKVKDVLPHVELIHSVASDSALRRLDQHGTPETQVLVEVDVAGEEAKAGIAPAELGAFIERCPVTVAGLMTMPPYTEDPEASRPYFAALRELAREHGLHHLSMGTSQDYKVAAEEGATIVRVGSSSTPRLGSCRELGEDPEPTRGHGLQRHLAPHARLLRPRRGPRRVRRIRGARPPGLGGRAREPLPRAAQRAPAAVPPPP